MTISPDQMIIGWFGPLPVTATLLFTWLVMILLVVVARLITRHISDGRKPSLGQVLLEVLIMGLNEQITQSSRQRPGQYLPFVGTLFLFIAVSNLLAIVPGFMPPTASLSTTTALALAVMAAVPIFAIGQRGFWAYLAEYFKPNILMLPFNLIGEFTRTLALAMRLYGNMMSGSVIGAILLGIVPLFFPLLLQCLGLITGLVQAYIFAVLAMVYIAAAQTVEQPFNSADSGETHELDQR